MGRKPGEKNKGLRQKMKLSGLKVLVTGGAGFIGSHLVDALVAEGSRVRVIDNLANGRLENLARHKGGEAPEFIKGDITDPRALGRAMKGAEAVFHLACLGVRHSIKDPITNHRVNSEGTLVALQAALENGVKRFIYCSSSEVYGTARSVPMKESHPTCPCTVYGASKLAGEAYARAYHLTYGLETVMVRPFNTYGPRSHHEGDAGELIPKSVVRALGGEDLLVFGDGAQTRDFTYVEDMARAIMVSGACDEAVGRTMNIGSDFEIAVKDVAKMIIEAAGSVSKIRFLDGRPGDVLRLYADSSEFRRLTGWRAAVTFKDGLSRTIEHFRSRPEGLAALLGQENGVNLR